MTSQSKQKKIRKTLLIKIQNRELSPYLIDPKYFVGNLILF
jgi:hypothetical protein